MEREVNDENMPTSSQTAEQQKQLAVQKKNRRRSSIGSELLASFFTEKDLESIATPEKEQAIRRSRRVAAVRADQRSKVLNTTQQRLSMDVGEQTSAKSCLTRKTVGQRAALKLVKKYRRSHSHTPCRRTLRFNTICTVRVITPRPQYDPDNLCLPSDDEDSRREDRERLSTVKLDITPQSQAYLKTIKDKDDANVEFRTQMIFGDGSQQDNEACSKNSDSRKRKRRKSLIVNAASPLRTPPPSKPDFDDSELKKTTTTTKQKSGGILKKPENVTKKERRRSGVVVQAPPPPPVEEKAKRGRRKSGLVTEPPVKPKSDFFAPRQLTVSEEEVKIIDAVGPVKNNRRKSKRFVTELVAEPSTSQQAPSTPTPSTAAPKKLFAMFSPRPSPKPVPLKIVEITDEQKPANISTTSSASSSSGRRKEKWGDRIVDTYCFMKQKTMIPETSMCEEQKNWFTTETRRNMSDDESQNSEFVMRKCEGTEEIAEIPACSGVVERPRDKDYGLAEYVDELKEFGAISFKPQKFDELVEGSEDGDQVRGWLKKWKRKVRREAKKQQLAETKKKGRKSKKSSSDDEEDSDYDGSDEEELQNPLILKGPTGVGKSAFISALAAEANMKIIGMGPDEERKGTSIKMKLTEALRSHRITTEPAFGSLVRLFQSQKVVYAPKSTEQPAAKQTIHDKEFQQSLVVFEHVDLLFGALDRNATTALIEMVNTSQVPIVWTCDDAWPATANAAVELERDPLIVALKRKKTKVRKYCQQLVYFAKNVWIDDDVMKMLASSVGNDMRALINQANFYAIDKTIPLPMTDRFLVSNGFQQNWDIDKSNEIEHVLSAPKWHHIESKTEKYREILNVVPDGLVKIDWPGVESLKGDRELLKKKCDTREHINAATDAFYGRYSKKSMNVEMIPLLLKMDKVEQKARTKSRRHQHVFTKSLQSEHPIDDDKLIRALAAIRTEFEFESTG